MQRCFANFFQFMKENRVAAFIGGSLGSLSTCLTLYGLYTQNVIMTDMNDDAAQAAIGAAGIAALAVGSIASAAVQHVIGRCSENDNDMERAAINTPGVRR